MTSLVASILLLCALLTVQSAKSSSQHPKLLVVSYDGFRYDYFDRNITPYMKNLRDNGTYVDHMVNVFSTKTFPNHHSIATGFYAETHGVMDTSVYVSNKTIKDSPELFQYNKDILPIWTINEQTGNGRHSGVVMWPGTEYKYNETVPQFVQKFDLSVSWQKRVDLIVSWFLHPETPINFGILYIEEPDFHGHGFGIQAPIINEMLKKLDAITNYLHRRLQENNLTDVNVIHLSDHGMISVTLDKIVNISSYISDVGYTAVTKLTIVMITPDPGNENIIYQRLKIASKETGKFDVYKKDEIPSRYHFGNNPRVGDIVVNAKSGYVFEDLYDDIDYWKQAFNITVNNQSEFGIHGYDNSDVNMHPIFFAQGPAFASKCKLEPFQNVDLFPLFCKVLDLKCPTVNGTLNSFNKCLSSSNDSANTSGFTFTILSIFAACFIGINTICALRWIRKRQQFTSIPHRSLFEETT